MKNAKLFFVSGAGLLMLLGLGHILVMDIFRSLFIQIENKEQILSLMVETDFIIVSDVTTMLAAFNGFSLLSDFLLFSFGAINLIFAKASIETVLRSKLILGLNIIVALVGLIISVNHFWYGGNLAFGLALLAFILAYIFKPASLAILRSV